MLALQQLLLFHLTLDSMQLELELNPELNLDLKLNLELRLELKLNPNLRLELKSNLELNLELKLNPDLNLDSFLGFTQGVLAEYGVIQHDSFTCV